MEPTGELNSDTGSTNDTNSSADEEASDQCAPGDAWWGRRLEQHAGFYFASCESMGWSTITTWCECKVAVAHVKILEGRSYQIGSSCDGPTGCAGEAAGCYIKDGTAYFNPPKIWDVVSCSSFTVVDDKNMWDEQPNRGCLCKGNPTTTTTTTTPHCTDYSGYYRNNDESCVAVQQTDCALTVTIEASKWTNRTEVEGGWSIFTPPTQVIQASAFHSTILFEGGIGRSLDIQSNPNGTEYDGTVNPNFPWGKVKIQFDAGDRWTRMTCNIFNGTYSDGTLDWAIMQSACLANITGGDLGVNAEGLGNYLLGNIEGNFLSFPNTAWQGRVGNLNRKLLTIEWNNASISKAPTQPWSRATVNMHSGLTAPPPE
jgi:hypothetical protein